MSLRYLTEEALNDLKINISTNIEKYKENDSFIENDYMLWQSMGGNKAFYEIISEFHLDNVNLKKPSEDKNHEIVNSIALHSALSKLTPIQASDERLWAYLSHDNFWEYMKERWPIKNTNKIENKIRDRYFFSAATNRGYTRNGIGRLWWYGYYAYDSSNKNDPYWLMDIIFRGHIQEIIERSFSHNKSIVLAILKWIKKIEENDTRITNREEYIRPLLKYLNQIGGATILDIFDSNEIQEKLMKKYQVLKSNS